MIKVTQRHPRPIQRNEIAFATFKRNAFISRNQRRTWKQIACDGKTLE